MKLNAKLILVSLLYFAEGFPFGLIDRTFPIYFRSHDMSLVYIGFLSFLTLPYALKFLWAPAVDFLGSRRRWITGAQFLMAAFILLLIPLNPADPSTLLWVVIASLAICSATQDVAIDAYTIEMLKPSEMGIANGFRQAAYRVALLAAGGMFVASADWIGWKLTFACAAGILLMCGLLALRLPSVEVPRPSVTLSSLIDPVRDLLARPGVLHVTLFILLYKLGDLSMGPMISPFWLARGLSNMEIGLITGTFGIFASIAGGLAGGLFMVRFGIFHGLWFLGIWQAVSNLTYAWVAVTPETGNWGIYAASVAESFCGGLGTAAFLAFLMSICNKQFSATQYAILSALFRIAGVVAGSLSGWATRSMGFGPYFALTFFLSLPAFFLILRAGTWIPADPNGNSGAGAPEEPAARETESPSAVECRGAPAGVSQ